MIYEFKEDHLILTASKREDRNVLQSISNEFLYYNVKLTPYCYYDIGEIIIPKHLAIKFFNYTKVTWRGTIFLNEIDEFKLNVWLADKD